ncbi:hypothetical protein BGZ83_008146 [Gryganskiella cystojenkinii]|nr:hypothetical protein BGZ83_008146 [Gryganskiella cystojenkinii]
MGRHSTTPSPPQQLRYPLRNANLSPEDPSVPKYHNQQTSTPRRTSAPRRSTSKSPKRSSRTGHVHVDLPQDIVTLQETNSNNNITTATNTTNTTSMYPSIGVFRNNQRSHGHSQQHQYQVDDESPDYGWTSSSSSNNGNGDKDGDDFENMYSDEDAMVALLERQRVELQLQNHPQQENNNREQGLQRSSVFPIFNYKKNWGLHWLDQKMTTSSPVGMSPHSQDSAQDELLRSRKDKDDDDYDYHDYDDDHTGEETIIKSPENSEKKLPTEINQKSQQSRNKRTPPSRQRQQHHQRHHSPLNELNPLLRLDWFATITLLALVLIVLLVTSVVFTPTHQAHRIDPIYGNLNTNDSRTHTSSSSLSAIQSLVFGQWSWPWKTRPRWKNAENDGVSTSDRQDIQDLQDQIQQILFRLERVNYLGGGGGQESVSPMETTVTATATAKAKANAASSQQLDIFSSWQKKAISDMIEDALGTDGTAKPDFALYSAGGRVLPHLTTASFSQPRQKLTLLGRWGGQFLVPHPKVREPRVPEKAIQPGMHAGECWAMQGDHGQLGIRLSRTIVVTEITLEHVDRRVSLDVGSAPRQVEIWRLPGSIVLSSGEESSSSSRSQPSSFELHPRHQGHRQRGDSRLGADTDDLKSSQSTIKGSWRNDNNHDSDNGWRSEPPVPRSMLLTSFEYQFGADQPQNKRVQTFSIPESEQDEPSIGLVVRVLSNWGHPDFTCLYRVRVHGYEVS